MLGRTLSQALQMFIVCLALLPCVAQADVARARAHFDKGRTFFEVDEYRKAIAEFKAAHIEKPDPAFLYNIAECYRRLGELPEALQFYRRFLATAPPDDKTRAIVEQRIADLKTVADEPKVPATEPPPGGGGDGAPVLNATNPSGDPAATLIETPAQRRPAPAPFYTRPWFLVTVGAVVVASVVGIWALSRAPEPPGTSLGNQSVF
jgi:tetratricopeptide (TPR) repeat protein